MWAHLDKNNEEFCWQAPPAEDNKNYVGQDCQISVRTAWELGISHIGKSICREKKEYKMKGISKDTGERFENEAHVGSVLTRTTPAKRQDVYLSAKR